MKALSNFSRYIVGILFIFSGLIKINDPVGTAIKLEEYFEVFSADFSSVFHVFVPIALPLSIVLCVLEVVLGIAVLVGYRMKLTSIVLLVIIVFFTFLTFYSAYFNKVTDCGCFGDAIKLTPWQSFTKDIILLVLILIIFFNRKYFKPLFSNQVGDAIVVGAFVLNFGVAYYTIEHLSFIDFRAYKVGADIPRLMKPSAEYKYKYVMAKNGKIEEFEKYPTDTTYQFKEMILLNPEAQPKITDFGVWNSEGDMTEQALKGDKLWIIIHTVDKTNTENVEEINKLVKGLEGQVDAMVFTSSDEKTFDNYRHEVQLGVPYYFADLTLLKTIIRSNPGLMLLREGVVLEKWHHNDVPDVATVKDLLR